MVGRSPVSSIKSRPRGFSSADDICPTGNLHLPIDDTPPRVPLLSYLIFKASSNEECTFLIQTQAHHHIYRACNTQAEFSVDLGFRREKNDQE